MHIHVNTYEYVCTYIYIYIEREREMVIIVKYYLKAFFKLANMAEIGSMYSLEAVIQYDV